MSPDLNAAAKSPYDENSKSPPNFLTIFTFLNEGNIMYLQYSSIGFSSSAIGQYAFAILRFISSAVSVMNIALSGFDLDIFKSIERSTASVAVDGTCCNPRSM